MLRVGGQTLIERALAELRGVFCEILIVGVVGKLLDRLGADAIIPDLVPKVGPLGGIYTGLEKMAGAYGFFVACDMPFLSAEVIRSQLKAVSPGEMDAVVPRWDGQVEPLHAVYGKACAHAARARIAEGARKIISFYGDVRVRYWDLRPAEKWRRYFHNINTREEFLALKDME